MNDLYIFVENIFLQMQIYKIITTYPYIYDYLLIYTDISKRAIIMIIM